MVNIYKSRTVFVCKYELSTVNQNQHSLTNLWLLATFSNIVKLYLSNKLWFTLKNYSFQFLTTYLTTKQIPTRVSHRC